MSAWINMQKGLRTLAAKIAMEAGMPNVSSQLSNEAIEGEMFAQVVDSVNTNLVDEMMADCGGSIEELTKDALDFAIEAMVEYTNDGAKKAKLQAMIASEFYTALPEFTAYVKTVEAYC